MIEFREVEKRYPNGYEALRHINLTIDQGEFVAIIGLSGAGKSTLIRTINRMHDITPVSYTHLTDHHIRAAGSSLLVNPQFSGCQVQVIPL